MTKRELINREYQALGLSKEFIEEKVTENGWCTTRKKCNFDKIYDTTHIYFNEDNIYWWRPATINSIDDNNGWKIVEDTAKLKSFNSTIESYVDGEIKRGYDERATHWRLANNKRPLYDE